MKPRKLRRTAKSKIPRLPAWQPGFAAYLVDLTTELQEHDRAPVEEIAMTLVCHAASLLVAHSSRADAERFLVATVKNMTKQGFAAMITAHPIEGSA